MNLRTALLSAAALVVGFAACGFPDFQYLDEDDGSGGAGAGTGGGPSSSSGGGTTGGGGTAPACELYGTGSCGGEQKCSVVDLATGTVGCVDAGPRGPYSRCSDDVECVEGTFCDPQLEVCKPICQSGNDCSTGAQCYPAQTESNQPIPGLELCTAHCHPTQGTPCDETNGPVTCYYSVERVEFDCAATLNFQDMSMCFSPTDCGMGLYCVNANNETICLPWCEPVNDFCLGISICTSINTKPTYDGTEYGVCP